MTIVDDDTRDGRRAADRRAAVARYADLMRRGQVERHYHFGHSWNGSPSEDITAEVQAAAGEETPEERELRAAYREEMLWQRIEGDIQVEMDTRFGSIFSPHFAGEGFEWDEDAEDTNEFVLIRKTDGRKFRVEISVSVEEITES